MSKQASAFQEKDDGAVLAGSPVICNEAPDDDAIFSCKALGAALA